MRALYALIAVAVLFGVVYLGTEVAGLHYLFGVVLPYAAMALFLVAERSRSSPSARVGHL